MFFNRFKLYTAKFILCWFIAIIAYSVVIHFNRKKVPDECFVQLNRYLNIEETFAGMVGMNTSLDVNMLWLYLENLNKERKVRNVQEFGPVSSDTPFVVVRVHRGRRRLQLLVASLARTAGVGDLLLIFSHSYYDQRINFLIRQIDFCMVLQIFYLNSVQLNPNTFPGFDAEELEYGTTNDNRSKRDPRLTEPKHHWWWTINYVFDYLVWPEPHTDMVIFIDESSYVLPDLFFMIISAKHAMSYFPNADVISLGSGPMTDSGYDRLTLEAWRAGHGSGLAFNKSTWRKISALGVHYCQYDDTSWSHSLLHLFRWFPGGYALALAAVAPRVLSSGVLPPGTRAIQPLCWPATQQLLYPRAVQAVVLYGRGGRVLSSPEMLAAGNGGWNDRRDIFQCYDFTIEQKEVHTSVFKPD